jgi:hypothetical protein
MKEESKESHNENDYLDEKNGNIIFNYDPNLNPHNKRSYSCKVNEQNIKKFSGCDEISLNLSKKYNFLKTPSLKPKKSDINPVPINIGNAIRKNSRFKPLNDDDSIDKNIFNDIISEGEKEVSHKDSSISSSDVEDKEEEKDNDEININNNHDKDDNFENEQINHNDEFSLLKIHSENKIFSLSDYKIKEENEDEYNEKGNLMLKNVRKKMFQTKKTFLKNDKDNFDITNQALDEKYKKYKEDILMPKKQVNFHNTISFTKPKNNGISILEFLRKKSSIDKTKIDN